MKKLVMSVIVGVVIIGGAGTYVYANANESGNVPFKFDQMRPHIDQIHPNLSTQEQKEMFNYCHGKDGYMKNHNYQGMINNY
ncbi:hypothetical protein [Paraliobacillus ryukyuensis]|uniref:hypothetical protein n=1 Tax=Paraliobacillus ryukyuensis TaxID=200904 RepID=UPI0009A76001|nr:hypothetical protein [Paraliobacillus ryukyuensis]